MQKKEKLAEKYENDIHNKDLVQRQKEVDKNQVLQNADTAVCC